MRDWCFRLFSGVGLDWCATGLVRRGIARIQLMLALKQTDGGPAAWGHGAILRRVLCAGSSQRIANALLMTAKRVTHKFALSTSASILRKLTVHQDRGKTMIERYSFSAMIHCP